MTQSRGMRCLEKEKFNCRGHSAWQKARTRPRVWVRATARARIGIKAKSWVNQGWGQDYVDGSWLQSWGWVRFKVGLRARLRLRGLMFGLAKTEYGAMRYAYTEQDCNGQNSWHLSYCHDDPWLS